MTIYFMRRRNALVAVGGLLAALTLGGVAQAITDNAFKYSTEKTGHFGIDAMALAPSNSAATRFASNWGVVAGLSPDAASGGACYNTGVNLPHGAKMTQLSVWSTSGEGGSYNVVLYRHKFADGAPELVVFQDLDGNGNRKQTSIAISPAATVNNTAYSYGFGVCMDNGAVFHAARVGYTYTSAGD